MSASVIQIKAGVHMKAVWKTRTSCQNLGHVSSDANSLCLFHYPLFECVNFWVIFWYFGKEIFFLNGNVK